MRSRTEDWKEAINIAINNEFPDGVRGKSLMFVSDNGSQPCSKAFMNEMQQLEIKQIFTAYNNPKGNAETERMMRTIKEELLWLNEFDNFNEAKAALDSWVQSYNASYPHSVLNYRSPNQFIESWNNDQVKEVA